MAPWSPINPQIVLCHGSCLRDGLVVSRFRGCLEMADRREEKREFDGEEDDAGYMYFFGVIY
ncbi:hypothetical protein HanPSC8_Chr03g0117411 [Helianthus annuus]|nr:hypothetical protein HanPSC8_Chr03g0117411 [Helianthus annuus]